MIIVDTSALMAILLGESEADACRTVVARELDIRIAAPTLTEALIVAAGRALHGEMARLIDDLALTVEPLTGELGYAAVRAYLRWGKRHHPAALNICDAFAYALATAHNCPLLFVGNDFAQTDVIAALAG
ncbi:type II toxin-antitoxin system VapC family toxin [Sphingomonas sp. DC1600-2]|uniref:type II toxin-antitoxin system VapC family toxin n=1 Tax=unclassified Sphingomonas TaxID=196159 RepID=UPI003CED1067